ncbi:MAG: Gfo/Idh/MocA family protein [Betaproteobacteria bacterium]
MSTGKSLNVGLVGTRFMGRAHSHAFRDLPMFFDTELIPVLKAICGQDEENARRVAHRFGWESIETDWRKLAAREDIDLIDISTPNDLHKDIALAAAAHGKHIFCEKPLATNLADARQMLAAVKAAGIRHMVGFNYRFCPAVQLAKKLLSENALGRLYHIRAQYRNDRLLDPDEPLRWRLQRERAGAGALGDIGSHMVDLARFLVGEFAEVTGLQETFVKKRPLSDGPPGSQGEVTVDDATLFLARFTNGSIGTFETTRFAAGRKNYNAFEINGSEGSLRFCFERMNELEYFNRRDPVEVQGFRTILVTQPSHKYLPSWWGSGHVLGYEHTFIHEVYELMRAIDGGYDPTPNFEDGVRCQEVLAAVELSVIERRWVRLDEV